jgi:hypothetical protein
MLFTRNAGERRIYWQGPSLGFDLGGDGGRTMMLVYNLPAAEALFGEGIHTRFVGLNGSAYVVGGFGFTAAMYDAMVVVPIRTGVGARLGVNVGYLKFTPEPTWKPVLRRGGLAPVRPLMHSLRPARSKPTGLRRSYAENVEDWTVPMRAGVLRSACSSGHGAQKKLRESRPPRAEDHTMRYPLIAQQFSFWWTGVRPKGHTGLEKDWAAILGRLGLIQGRDGGARQPAERRAALL